MVKSHQINENGDVTNVSGKNSHTFPTPEQFEHLCVVGTRKGRLKSPFIEIGSVLKHTPLAEHRAQAKYPAKEIC